MVVTMASTQLADTPMLDILPPPAPLDQTMLMTVLVVAVMGLVLFMLYQLWQRRPRQQAFRQLLKLQKQLERQQLDNRECLYEVNRLLCKGFALSSLSQIADKHFYQRLSRLQYCPTPPEHEPTRQLLAEACLLLRGSRA